MGEAVSPEIQGPLADTGTLMSLSGRSWGHKENAAAVRDAAWGRQER